MTTCALPEPGAWWSVLGAPMGAWEDGSYRFLLWRAFYGMGLARPMGFGMLNPSKAGAVNDDPTIRRCLGYAHRENAGGIIVVNCSPYRATDPRDLKAAHLAGVDVFQSERNDEAIRMMSLLCDVVVAAWGGKITPWLDGGARSIRRHATHCLGRTYTGEPYHPLMQPKNARLVPFGMEQPR